MSESRAAWTAAYTSGSLARRKGGKYGATKVTVDGYQFDSKKEATRWRELSLMQQAGEINDLQRQTEFPLRAWARGPLPVVVGAYVADFQYWRGETCVVEDVKSPATRRIAAYRLKAKLFAANYGFAITEV